MLSVGGVRSQTRWQEAQAYRAIKTSRLDTGRSTSTMPYVWAFIPSCTCWPGTSNGTCAGTWRRYCSRTTTKEGAGQNRTAPGFPVHSMKTLVADPATLTLNEAMLSASQDHAFTMVAEPTCIQERTFELTALDRPTLECCHATGRMNLPETPSFRQKQPFGWGEVQVNSGVNSPGSCRLT